MKSLRKRSSRTLRAILLPVVLLVLTARPGTAGSLDMSPCDQCHSDICETFLKVPHGELVQSDLVRHDNVCESCHGSGAAHATSGDPNDIINPAKSGQVGGNQLCLSCHKGSEFDDWPFAAHQLADVSCASCHQVHASYTEPPSHRVTQHCLKCHPRVRAEMTMPSHHPILEGKLSCIDCHNPHGGPTRMTQDRTGRELCFSCHADKEGPFVYEHAPVNEDCMICHTPHGAISENLLKQSEPTLCLSCHAMHFHATDVGVDGPFAVPLDSTRNGVSTPNGWKLGMLTKCTQCHGAIHGTDSPSQTISTGGNALTR